MSPTISLVQAVQIASPCTAKWDDMVGDERSRFCSHCRLNVYNLSAMTEEEGERLIIEKEGMLCARIYRRFDGTVLTRDCPVGLRALRKRVAWLGMRAAAALTFIIGSAAYAVSRSQPKVDLPPHLAKRVQEIRETRPPTFTRMRSTVNRWLTQVAPPPPLPAPPSAGWTGGVVRLRSPSPSTVQGSGKR